MGRTRALVAAALAVVYPGLGHLYLRAWFRAVAWFALSLLTAAVVIPESVVAAYDSGGVTALLDASRTLPTDALIPILGVRALNVVDAAWLGLRPTPESRAAEAGEPTCPNCGRDLDDDLDFCHWCTKPLDGTAEESPAGGGLL